MIKKSKPIINYKVKYVKNSNSYKKINLFFFKIFNLINFFFFKKSKSYFLNFLINLLKNLKNILLKLRFNVMSIRFHFMSNFFINSNLNLDFAYIKRRRFQRIQYIKKFVLKPFVEGYSTFFSILLGLNLNKMFFNRFAYIFFRFALKNRSIRSMNNIILYIRNLYNFIFFFYFIIKKVIFVYFKRFDFKMFNYLIINCLNKFLNDIFYFIYLICNKKIYKIVKNFKYLKNVNYYSFSFCLNNVKKNKNKSLYFEKKKINIYIYFSFFFKFMKFLFIK